MGNNKAYNYLKKYSGKYDINRLKNKLIQSGYSKKDVEEAANALNKSVKKNSLQKNIRPVQKKVQPKTNISKQNKQISQNFKQKSKDSENSSNKKVNFNIPKTKKSSNLKDTKKTEKNNLEKSEKSSKKNWIWIVLIIFVGLAILAGLFYFFFLK